jgi:hypothetical protein
VSGETDAGTEVVMTAMAEIAPATRQCWINCDPLPMKRTAFDHAGELVAENERDGDGGISDPALAVPVQIRAAQADCLDAHEALAGSRSAHRLDGDAQVMAAVQARNYRATRGSPADVESAVKRGRAQCQSPRRTAPRPRHSDRD